MSAAENLAVVAGLEPARVWHYFAEIAAVPRASKHEARVRDRVRELAAAAGFTSRTDAAGNLVIDVPASSGCENAPVTVLQGHLDMVCEKNTGTEHDFDRDPIRLVRDQDSETGAAIIRAAGTTLGADNGIGIAMALAAATDPAVVHPPLEILCTLDEEAGMGGAEGLTPDSFRGRRLINLDSEEDDVLYIGCAGGGDTSLKWELRPRPLPPTAELVSVAVRGLRGGHSGTDIHENRANANKVLVATLTASGSRSLRLARIQGGSKRNAIAREASAVVAGGKSLLRQLTRAAAEVQAATAREHREPGVQIEVAPWTGERPATALSPADTQRLLRVLTALPHGVMEMHAELPGLVQTSNNVATIVQQPHPNDPDGWLLVVGCLARSSSVARLAAAREQLAAVAQLGGGTAEFGHTYPGWQPDTKSPLLNTCRRIYRELFGTDAKVTAIHAGLECGVIGRQVGGLDMASLGPNVKGAHSPDERVYIDSVQKSYRFLRAILADLARG